MLLSLKVLYDENSYGLKVVSIERPSFNIEPQIFYFLNLKGHHPLNSIKLVLALTFTKSALIYQISTRYKKLVAGPNV